MNENAKAQPARNRKFELVAVALFVVVNLFAPLVVGELYPFTVSPMFRDQPEQYCTYRLYDESGNELELENFGLHLVYDGNPPGLGMGVEAKETLHEFGEVPELGAVVQHVQFIARQNKKPPKQIRIQQTVVCCNGTRPEATVHEETIKVAIPGTGESP